MKELAASYTFDRLTEDRFKDEGFDEHVKKEIRRMLADGLELDYTLRDDPESYKTMEGRLYVLTGEEYRALASLVALIKRKEPVGHEEFCEKFLAFLSAFDIPYDENDRRFV